jgi:hypothetical protein
VRHREVANMVDRVDDQVEAICKEKLPNAAAEQVEALEILKKLQPLLWAISFALKQPEVSARLGTLSAARELANALEKWGKK